MDLQLLNRTEGLLERAARVGVTVELLDDGKLRMRGSGPVAGVTEERALVAQELRARRADVAVVLAVPRPSVDQELERDERGWIWLAGAAGPCVVCDEPCRSWDDENRPRHPTCGLEAA
jgi:hypothetical protein